MLEANHVLAGKYRLLRILGEGGMGSVWEARHELLGTRVAVKIVHPELLRRPGLSERFLQEARVSAQIRSPHVVQVMDVDRDGGMSFMVMELLLGEALSAVMERQRRIAVPVACEYARQVLEGLEAAHALGVVHRDLKPENVFVTFAASRPVLKIIDFGIAKVRRTDGGARRGLTAAGVSMGTAEYMAPEQAFSADQADARSDVYALGVMLYEMLSGARPVVGPDARAIAAMVMRGEGKPLVHVAPEVPRELAGLVHRAMAPRPDLRFASATEMRLALERFLVGTAGTRPVVAVQSAGPVTASTEYAVPAGLIVQGGPMPGGAPATERAPGGPSAVAHGPGAARATSAIGASTSSAAGATVAPNGPWVPNGVPGPATGHGSAVFSGPPAHTGPARRRRKSLVVPVLLGLLVVSVGIVVVALFQESPSSTPRASSDGLSVSPTSQSTPSAAVTAAPTTKPAAAPPPEAPAAIPTLVGPGPHAAPPPSPRPTTAPTSVPTSIPTSAPTTAPTTIPSQVPGFPTPSFPIPSGFPSSLPFPTPSGLPPSFPTALPMPSGFPSSLPFPFPGAPTATPPSKSTP